MVINGAFNQAYKTYKVSSAKYKVFKRLKD
jgi:hypothetical protein